MASDHDDHHGHPKPPDTSKLWVDEGWRTIADDSAKMWFVITMTCVVLYGAAVVVWIFL